MTARRKQANHTNCRRGEWVSVKLSNGVFFTDQFVERKGKFLVFKKEGRFHKADVIRFSVVSKRLKYRDAGGRI